MSVEQLKAQLETIAGELGGDGVRVQLDRPRNPEHGDVATNVALVLAPKLGAAPRAVAERVLERLDLNAAGVTATEIAGPGFINFRFGQGLIEAQLAEILAQDRAYGRQTQDSPQRIMVEFVSANPTGPLHVAHGRGAALGDAIASLHEWEGHEVTREFYVNDAGGQIDRLAESVEARWLELRGETAAIPEGGYHGAYVTELAAALDGEVGDELAALPRPERLRRMRDYAVERLRAQQEEDLRAFRVRFDEFYAESRLYAEERIPEALEDLRVRGIVFEQEGAIWLRTTLFGDDKDRVLVKSDGSYTYFTPDIAYHRDKARRGFDHAIDVWGADHHGYEPRMQAALAALGMPDFLDVEIVQMVRLMRGEEEVKFSKRSGEFITLRDLFEETGVDVARYFFLMRRADAQMLFDLDLAMDHSEKNPVFKVQYAHARMMSIFRKAGVRAEELEAAPPAGALAEPVEQELVKQLARFPALVARAADARSPHIVCEYLETTAGMVNSWYHAGNPSRNPRLAVLVEDEQLRAGRLALARGVQIVLRNGLELLGLTAPERMEREESA